MVRRKEDRGEAVDHVAHFSGTSAALFAVILERVAEFVRFVYDYEYATIT